MQANFTAELSTIIHCTRRELWDALTQPELIKQYFFGTHTSTTWEPGTPIRFDGEWQGNTYTDKGTVLAYNTQEILQYDYWSSMGGKEDLPENYMIITYRVGGEDGNVTVTVLQENIADENTRDHAINNWKTVLEALKKMLEEKQDL